MCIVANNYVKNESNKDVRYSLVLEKYENETGRYWLVNGNSFFPLDDFSTFVGYVLTDVTTNDKYLFEIVNDSKQNAYIDQGFEQYLRSGIKAKKYRNNQLGKTLYVGINPNFPTGYSGSFAYLIDTSEENSAVFFYQNMLTITQANGDYFFDCSKEDVYCNLAIAPYADSALKNRGLYACDDPAKLKAYDITTVSAPLYYYRVTGASNGLYKLVFTPQSSISTMISPPSGYSTTESDGKLGIFYFGAIKKRYYMSGREEWYIDTASMTYYAKWATTIWIVGDKMRIGAYEGSTCYYQGNIPTPDVWTVDFTLTLEQGDIAPRYSPLSLTFSKSVFSPATTTTANIYVTDANNFIADTGGLL